MWSLDKCCNVVVKTMQVFSSKFAMEIDCGEYPSYNSSGGYDLALFEKAHLLEKYECVICKKILRDAVQIHENQEPRRACRKCYTDNIR